MKPLARLLLAWYRKAGRSLPWRNHPDPYAVWVSEIMLQQTRVETVIPYFERWMRRFPNIAALAHAEEGEVLRAWEGLGYYSRARNLHKAAKLALEKFNGNLPRDLSELRNLPGIGKYTVGAIASMAFGMDEPTLDGNLRRVFSRLFDLNQPADSSAGEAALWNLAAQHLPRGKAGDYNQALMDLGATICVPKNPRCPSCPLRAICLANQRGTQTLRPVLKPKKQIPHHLRGAVVILRGGKVLLAKRPARGLLGGMWEFPNAQVDSDPQTETARAIFSFYQIDVTLQEKLGEIHHAYTHFKVSEQVFRAKMKSLPKPSPLKWTALAELRAHAMGKIDRQIANMLEE